MIDVARGVPGVNAPDPGSYREFWAYYLSQHLHPMTRRVHALATTSAILTGVTALLRRRWKVLAASPLLAYGPAFSSHWIWEGNNPVVLGKGRRLFGETSAKKPLKLTDSKTVGAGVEILIYEPAAG